MALSSERNVKEKEKKQDRSKLLFCQFFASPDSQVSASAGPVANVNPSPAAANKPAFSQSILSKAGAYAMKPVTIKIPEKKVTDASMTEPDAKSVDSSDDNTPKSAESAKPRIKKLSYQASKAQLGSLGSTSSDKTVTEEDHNARIHASLRQYASQTSNQSVLAGSFSLIPAASDDEVLRHTKALKESLQAAGLVASNSAAPVYKARK